MEYLNPGVQPTVYKFYHNYWVGLNYIIWRDDDEMLLQQNELLTIVGLKRVGFLPHT